jgi:DNA-binding CsgD family transcriptional regulator
MALSERTERALEACHDAVFAPELWPAALQRLADSLNVASCTFYPVDATSLHIPMSAEHLEFNELWHSNEAHAPCLYKRRAPCRTGLPYVIEQQIVTAEERRTDPYFHETARPGNRDWWASVGFSVGDQVWSLSLYRDAARGAFTHEAARYAAGIRPHLARTVAFAAKYAEVRVASAMSALERLTCAALVIDGRGVVRYLNELAGNLIGDDFHLVAGRPAAGDPASNRRLRQLLASILHTRWGCVPESDQVVIDRGGMPWLHVQAIPVTAFGSDLFSEGRAILLLTELTAPPPADATLLALVFGLTAAEAKMGARIASGIGIDEAAAALGVSRETARSQLKAVFLKTNTRRQIELIALIGRLRPPIRS